MGEGRRLAEAVTRVPTIASTVCVVCVVGLDEVVLLWYIGDGTPGRNTEFVGNGAKNGSQGLKGTEFSGG